MSPVTWGTVQVAEIPPYSDEEAKEVWYDDKELQDIASIMWKTVELLNLDKPPPANNEEPIDRCTRGLEEMTLRGSLARIVAKYSMDRAVLEEQKNQRAKGIHDAEALANASKAESEVQVHKARAFALRDQEYADRYLNRSRESANNESPTPKRRVWFKRAPRRERDCLIRPRLGSGVKLRRLLGMKG